MTLSSTCNQCEVCIHRKYCPSDNQDMFAAMGSMGIENSCVAFGAHELLEPKEQQCRQ
ncbi:MAG: hypothetical protein FWC32_00525 [Firmicutes bacterium]|nr:hypothetical protein [Bacillota bacterium]